HRWCPGMPRSRYMTMRLDMDTATHPDIGTEAIGAADMPVGGAEHTSGRFAGARNENITSPLSAKRTQSELRGPLRQRRPLSFELGPRPAYIRRLVGWKPRLEMTLGLGSTLF